MKKKPIAVLLLLAMLLGNAVAVDLYVDGGKLQPDVAPTIISGRTLVPMRTIFEALGASVTWDNAANTATAQKDGVTVQVTIDHTTAYINGQADTLDVPAQLIQNRTMVPARFVSEALRARVLWDGSTETVYIITDGHRPLVVEYLDVGQADCMLLSSGGEYMLIDAGNNADGDDVVSYLRTVGADRLKYAVGTHPHADHIGGLDDVLNAVAVDEVLLPNATTNTATFRDVLDAIEANDLTVTVPRQGDSYTLGDATVTVVAALQSDELNDNSIVLRATYGDTSFLFMGDAQDEVERSILAAGANISCDVLKVGHHGSDTSTGAAFLAAAAPKAAVICCGANNSYGHPSQTVLNRLTGIPVWRTDVNGTIIAMTDGQRCTLTASQGTAAVSSPVTPPTPPTIEDDNQQDDQPDDAAPSTVYVTPTGKRYHFLASCAGKNAAPSTLSNAKSRGLTPCQKCAA